MEELWREYWKGEASEDAILAFEAGELSRTTLVVAESLDMALAEARRLNPGMSAMRTGSSEIGQ